jgi:hypothetical protein
MMERTPRTIFFIGLATGATLMLGAALGYSWLNEPAPDEPYAMGYSLSGHEPPDFVEPAKNYIENDRQVLPALITACGARFLAFDEATDEVGHVYFSVPAGRGDQISCISRRVPNLHVRRADPEMIKNRLSWETIAYFARPSGGR